jgi:hypothetical protein
VILSDGTSDIAVADATLDENSLYILSCVDSSQKVKAVEKRDRTTGNLVNGFGDGGVYEPTWSAYNDFIRDVVVHGDHLLIGGLRYDEMKWLIDRIPK